MSIFRKHQFFTALCAALFLAIVATYGSAGAQQEKAASPQEAGKKQDTKPAQDDGPVAVTPVVPRTGNTMIPEAEKLESGQLAMMGFPDLNNKGEVAFFGRYMSATGPQGVMRAIMVKGDKGLRIAVREGDKPVNYDCTLTEFFNPSITEAGDLAFVGYFNETNKKAPSANSPVAAREDQQKSGIFLKNALGLFLLVKSGQEVPRMPSTTSNLGTPSINSKGLLAFIGTYVDPDGRGLFYLDSTQDAEKQTDGTVVGKGRINLVVRSGQRVAAVPTAVYSEHYYPSSISESGDLAFFVRMGDGGGIFVKRGDKVELIAQQGKEAPVSEAKFIGFGNINPSINDKGDIAFVAFFDGPNAGRGLFVKEAGKEGPPRLVLRSGDEILKTETQFTSFNSPAINARGDIAFLGNYGGMRTRGVFLKTEKGLTIIARGEDPVPGGKVGDAFNNFANIKINDKGRVVFYGQLRTGSVGVFVWDEEEGLRQLVKRGERVPDEKMVGRN
ncbi:MAG: choice-of-anchor tandem repeat NxxGxxAF-containing protein [Blastocatellia bacterium]